jgi:hypothetical protein
MQKYVILSSTDDPKYSFHLPLACWAWKRLGWEPIVFYYGDHTTELFNLPFRSSFSTAFWWLKPISGFQPATIAQVSRLYGACLGHDDAYLITSDADMIPLSDYWEPDIDKLTVYGRDLTDYHYPICYIGMDVHKWREVMNIDGDDYQYYMQRDLMTLPQAKSQDKVKRWVVDQDLITERINNSKFVPERVDRGMYKNGYPVGRVDRSAWTLDHKQFIDAHLPHDILTNDQSFKKVLELLHTVWPKEDWKWWVTFYKEFKKMMK